MSKLSIFYNEQKVGSLNLIFNSNELSLLYDEEWIKNGFSLSPKLPLDGNYNNQDVKNFIENLLPEGDGLSKLVEYLQVSKNNQYALIKEMGAETTGALIFINDIKNLETKFVTKDFEELTQRIKNRKNQPIEIWDGQPRLSVAGVQSKLPITILDEVYGFGEGNICSTHILKFDKYEDINRNIVINEYISLYLAKKAGLNVVKMELKHFDEDLVLQVERFDRDFISNNEIKRKFVIDACQALCLPVNYKYEMPYGDNGDMKYFKEGVSFEKLFNLVKKCDSPIVAKKQLVDWLIVNLCLGNSDSHGKNISFFKEKGIFRITPFYDIVNCDLYKDTFNTSFAMGINGEFTYDDLGAYDIVEFCKIIDINLKLFVSSFEKIASKILNALVENSEEIQKLKELNEDFISEYTNNVQTRTHRLLEIVRYSLEYSRQQK